MNPIADAVDFLFSLWPFFLIISAPLAVLGMSESDNQRNEAKTAMYEASKKVRKKACNPKNTL